MPKTRMVQKYTDQAIEHAKSMSKEQYQKIKHMPKIELVHYLDQLCNAAYQSGYEKGFKQGRGSAAGTVDQPAIVDVGK